MRRVTPFDARAYYYYYPAEVRGCKSPAVIGSGGFSVEAQQFFVRLDTPPAAGRQVLYAALIDALVAGGVWTRLDALYVFAAADAATALTNLKSSSFTASAVNAPTFTADEGYAGNGTTSYVDTNCNSDDTVQYVQDSACFGVWTRVVGDAGGFRVHGWLNAGATVGCYVGGFTSDTTGTTNINGAFDSRISTAAAGGGTGLWVGNRSGASAVQLYRNGASVQTGTTASVAIEAVDFWLGTRDFDGSTNQGTNEQFSASVIGASLDATQQDALYDALLAYLQGVGAVA